MRAFFALFSSRRPSPLPPLASPLSTPLTAGHPEYEAAGIRQLRLPTLDYCSPTTQQLEAGLDFIRRQPAGGSVYVHCKAGRGRAGTMLMAYLIDAKRMSPTQAQAGP